MKRKMKYSALIVDDEYSGRTAVKIILDQHFGHLFKVIEVANSLEEAIAIGRKNKFDVCFLDIQLGKDSGFELLQYLNSSTRIIFVTAYSEFAIKALRASAFDYILKPISVEEFKACVERFLDSPPVAEKKKKHLRVRDQGETIPVSFDQIEYIRARGSYSEVKLISNTSYITSKTLKSILTELDENFIRIHKSFIVNRHYIQAFQTNNLTTTLHSCLPLSRNGSKELAQQF